MLSFSLYSIVSSFAPSRFSAHMTPGPLQPPTPLCESVYLEHVIALCRSVEHLRKRVGAICKFAYRINVT